MTGRPQHDRILLVDDEPNILITTQAILLAEGYEVDTAGSGEEALQILKATNYDLLIADLNMEGMNGLELLEHTNSLFPKPLTIMLTGYASLESAIKALHLGAYDYLIKPCSIIDLKYSVKRALERRRLSETEALLQVSRTITSSFDKEEILNTVACNAANMLGLDRGIITLFETCGGARTVPISTVPCEGDMLSGEMLNRLLQENLEIREQLLSGTPFACEDASVDERVSSDWQALTGSLSFLVAPISSNDRLFGILYVDSKTKRQGFSSAAIRLIQGLADQAAIALENSRLYSEVVSKNRELDELNKKLQRLDKIKNNFLNIASHDLRTPISVVLGYITMLQDELHHQINNDQREMFAESVNNCQRLINLINSMLDISRIEAGKLEINILENDIRPCIEAAVRLLRERMKTKEIALELKLPESLPLVPFDEERLQQVLINLMDNAVKFTRRGGKITIRCAVKKISRVVAAANAGAGSAPITTAEFGGARDQVLEVAVEDTGVGIAEHEKSVIFDEFEQSMSSEQQGERLPSSGLGLAIAKKIIDAHEGKIWVESRLNEGSKFIFHLPIPAPQPHQKRARRAATGRAKLSS